MVLFSFIAPVIAQTYPAGSVLIIKAARLIDGRGGTTFAPAMVRIEGDRIAEVGRDLPVPPTPQSSIGGVAIGLSSRRNLGFGNATTTCNLWW